MKHLKSLALAGAFAASIAAADAKETLKMATIAPGSSAYLVMTTFANLVNQNQDEYEFTVDATGAATKHGIELARGKLDYVMSSPTVHHFLKNKLAMYQKVDDHAELAENIRLVMWFPYGQYHVVVYEDSGIKTLQDLRGKKVFLGPPGGGAWNSSRDWLKHAAGLDVEAGDYENVKASWSSAFQGFQDRQFDALVTGGIAPYPQIEQIAVANEIRLLGLTEEEYQANTAAQDYIAGLTGRQLGVIKQDAYGDNVKMDHDVYTYGSIVGIVARADLPEEQVYQVTKAYWDAVKEARESTPWLRDITLEIAVADGGMPLHPGAQRYYEEIGLTIPEGSKAE